MKRIFVFLTVLTLMLAAFVAPVDAAAGDSLFCATRAVRISDTEVVVEFTMPLDENGIDAPFTALRWMQMVDDQPNTLAWDGSKPLQAQCKGWSFWSDDDHQRIIVEFTQEALDSFAETDGNQYYEMGYRAFFEMEEKNPASGHDHETLHDVHSADGKELRSNCPAPGDNWDGVCLVVEVDYDYEPGAIAQVTEAATEEITFGDDLLDTDPPEVTDAPKTDAPKTEAPDGSAEVTGEPTDEKSGCGSMIACAPAVLVSMLGVALIASKKH